MVRTAKLSRLPVATEERAGPRSASPCDHARVRDLLQERLDQPIHHLLFDSSSLQKHLLSRLHDFLLDLLHDLIMDDIFRAPQAPQRELDGTLEAHRQNRHRNAVKNCVYVHLESHRGVLPLVPSYACRVCAGSLLLPLHKLRPIPVVCSDLVNGVLFRPCPFLPCRCLSCRTVPASGMSELPAVCTPFLPQFGALAAGWKLYTVQKKSPCCS